MGYWFSVCCEYKLILTFLQRRGTAAARGRWGPLRPAPLTSYRRPAPRPRRPCPVPDVRCQQPGGAPGLRRRHGEKTRPSAWVGGRQRQVVLRLNGRLLRPRNGAGVGSCGDALQPVHTGCISYSQHRPKHSHSIADQGCQRCSSCLQRPCRHTDSTRLFYASPGFGNAGSKIREICMS
jgi:hypothetical protein